MSNETPLRHGAAKQQIIAEIEHLRSELAGRRTLERPAPGSVVDAYRALIDRQYERLDRLDPE